MAISVLDTFAAPRVRGAARAAVATPSVTRRLPLAVAAAGSLGVLQSVALLAVALTGLDAVLSAIRPGGMLIGSGLVLLAGWIVLCAGSGAALIDGAGRRLFTGVAYAEMALVAVLLVVATVTPFQNPTSLPVPALGLLALALPVGKLLLAGAPSAQRWIAEGPRVRARRVDPVQSHRLLATITLGLIGASLCAVAILAPVPSGGGNDPASAVFTQP
ncbi:hypothetical protein E4P40_13975 [Blastococcus sp. CT_GayMR20]|uniref:hypothetical protein n=1 Tax=Blastococcus sp. CT_GayMR20 TaxID=2559609 RepID=UPI001073CE50|nr:hypothetical protein [Blastococcus sp. CT_GayMR20]TFV83495.1 hypothetical protein E4P40_13975 [Blastococcus sp. CT_GayMR20]